MSESDHLVQDELLVEDFSAQVEEKRILPLQGCEACRGCLLWKMRDREIAAQREPSRIAAMADTHGTTG